jgi:hypothetical protein
MLVIPAIYIVLRLPRSAAPPEPTAPAGASVPQTGCRSISGSWRDLESQAGCR